MKVLLDKIIQGYELVAITREITLGNMRAYEGWPERKNLHCDDETAQQAGLPRAVCRGNMLLSYVSEMLCNVFGQYWLKGGKLSINFLVPVFYGDTATARGRVAQRTGADSDISFIIEVSVENRRGEKAAAGTATLKVPGNEQ